MYAVNLKAARFAVPLSLQFTAKRAAYKLRVTEMLSEKSNNDTNMNIRSREQLQEHVGKGNKVKYIFFWGHTVSGSAVTKACFSQWYYSPFEVEGVKYLTAEHYMMYRKAKLFEDSSAINQLLESVDPGKAKAIGRTVKGFDQTIWEEHRMEIAVSGNVAKFSSNPELKEFLISTGKRILVEASPVDKIWGIGLEEKNSSSSNPYKWKGENLLGFALMEARDLLSEQSGT